MKSQTMLHNRKPVLSQEQRKEFEQAREYYLHNGYPKEIANQYARDHVAISGQVKRMGLNKWLERKYGH